MAHLLLEPIDWSALLQHEHRVCVPGLHQRPIRNLGAFYQPRPQRLRHPIYVQRFPSPIRENEFAPQFHPVSLLQQFLANTRQHLDVTETCLALGRAFSVARQTPSDQNAILVKEDTRPTQSEDFSAAHAGEKAN